MRVVQEPETGLEPEQIARICHAANRAYAEIIGEGSGLPWDDLGRQMQDGIIAGVEGAIEGKTLRESHDAWCAEKLATGWKYGPHKDARLKTHPNLRPFDELPIVQRRKDALFITITLACQPQPTRAVFKEWEAADELPAPETIEEAIHQRNIWAQTAALHAKNEQYWRDIAVQFVAPDSASRPSDWKPIAEALNERMTLTPETSLSEVMTEAVPQSADENAAARDQEANRVVEEFRNQAGDVIDGQTEVPGPSPVDDQPATDDGDGESIADADEDAVEDEGVDHVEDQPDEQEKGSAKKTTTRKRASRPAKHK